MEEDDAVGASEKIIDGEYSNSSFALVMEARYISF